MEDGTKQINLAQFADDPHLFFAALSAQLKKKYENLLTPMEFSLF